MSNTLQALQSLAPKAKLNLSSIASAIDTYAERYGINNDKRMKAFLAQAAHETAGFNTFTEYASGEAYEGRADLGNTQPGDGKKFKGRGIFQTTGRTNYKSTSQHLFGDNRLLETPELLTDPVNAVRSAMYYWQYKGLSELADKDDFKTITKRINGGLNGWKDRLSYFDKLSIFF